MGPCLYIQECANIRSIAVITPTSMIHTLSFFVHIGTYIDQ